MRNIKVVIEYDGTRYKGFQYQPAAPTIQGELENVLGGLVKEPVTVYGAGRTDAGVHASGQVINFRSQCTIPIEKICIAMNSRLPADIAAVAAEEAEDDFHARYSAVRRVYLYRILNRELRSALQCRFAWHVDRQLDAEAMNEAAKGLLGFHDFGRFARKMHEDDCTFRRMDIAEVERQGDDIVIEIGASGFLRSMVRSIVGALVDIGCGRIEKNSIKRLLQCDDADLKLVTAPPQGLCLVRVDY